MDFICDFCGSHVKLKDDKCPSCGVSFDDIHCPQCHYKGSPTEFISGCPICNFDALPMTVHKKKKISLSVFTLVLFFVTVGLMVMSLYGIM